MANFVLTQYGFWRQTDASGFRYDQEYKNKQSTNEKMACLRIGWMSAYFGYNLKNFSVVDVGCGNGAFTKAGHGIFKKICGYDIIGESISKSELMNTNWDIAIFSDVIEHMVKVEEFFEIPWKHAFVSFPETPLICTQEELHHWRHYKPNEHIWCLNLEGMKALISDNDCNLIASSCMEDLIRTRWNPNRINISSLLIRRNSL